MNIINSMQQIKQHKSASRRPKFSAHTTAHQKIKKAPKPEYDNVQRNIALELVRVTEAAALNSGRWFGKGDKEGADQAAVDSMRKVLNSISMTGRIVIGEGEKDEAPMLYTGEIVGDGSDPVMDIAVDPLDGTTLISHGKNGAIAVIAMAERDSMFNPGPCMYMEKLVVGPKVPANVVSLDYPPHQNISAVADALGKTIQDVTVVILDRPRHKELIEEIRACGARIKLIADGDVAGAIEAAREDAGGDILMGVGGTPEGVISACAMKCLDGSMYGRLYPRNEEEKRLALEQGYDLDKILTTQDLCSGNKVVFAATGVSDGDLLDGVRYGSTGATTHSIVMRQESGTIRLIQSFHKWSKSTITNPFHLK